MADWDFNIDGLGEDEPEQINKEKESEKAKPSASSVSASSAPTQTNPGTGEKPATKLSKARMQQKLLDLQLKANDCRKRGRQAAGFEATEKSGGNAGVDPGPANKKQKRKEEVDVEKERVEQLRKNLEKDGVDPETYSRLHQTQTNLDYREKTSRNKGEVDVYGEEAQYRAFKKRRMNTHFSTVEYDRQKESFGDEFYNATQGLEVKATDSAARVEYMAKEVSDQDARRARFSRRRAYIEEGDVTFINERNRKFNQKVGRAFDKYTSELKDNLERGTAL